MSRTGPRKMSVGARRTLPNVPAEVLFLLSGGLMKGGANGPSGRLSLFGGFLLSVLSAGCCAIPLVLVSLGAGAALAGQFELLERYRPILVFASLILTGWSLFRMRRSAGVCHPGGAAASGAFRQKGFFWALVLLTLLLLGLSFLSPERNRHSSPGEILERGSE